MVFQANGPHEVIDLACGGEGETKIFYQGGSGMAKFSSFP